MKHRGAGRVFQRPNSSFWWIGYCVNGREVRESSGSEKKSDAVALLQRRLAEKSSGKIVLGEAKVTLGELAADLERDFERDGKRTLETVRIRLKHILAFFGSAMKAVNVSSASIKKFIDARLEAGTSNATANRETAVLRRMFNLAKQDGKIVNVPGFKKLEEPPARCGFMEVGDLESIRQHLPELLQDVVTLLFYTGMRKNEALSLQWWNVDREAGLIRLSGEQTKNKRPKTVPILAVLRPVIERRWKARLDACPLVFHRSGRPVKNFYGAWRNACTLAGHEGRLLHDFRRSAARSLVRAGVPDDITMAVLGHRTRSMLTRYDIVSEDDLKVTGEKLTRYLEQQQGQEPKVIPIEKASG